MNLKHIDQKNIKCLKCNEMFFDTETMSNHNLGHERVTKNVDIVKKIFYQLNIRDIC